MHLLWPASSWARGLSAQPAARIRLLKQQKNETSNLAPLFPAPHHHFFLFVAGQCNRQVDLKLRCRSCKRSWGWHYPSGFWNLLGRRIKGAPAFFEFGCGLLPLDWSREEGSLRRLYEQVILRWCRGLVADTSSDGNQAGQRPFRLSR